MTTTMRITMVTITMTTTATHIWPTSTMSRSRSSTLRIHTDIPTSPPSGLRNGPTYVALALWLNGPPCKWSGVEWIVYVIIGTVGIVDNLLVLVVFVLFIKIADKVGGLVCVRVDTIHLVLRETKPAGERHRLEFLSRESLAKSFLVMAYSFWLR